MDALDRQLALGRAPGLTAPLLRAAHSLLAGPAGADALAALFAQSRMRLESLGIPAGAAAALLAPSRAQLTSDRDWVEREGIVLVDAFTAAYPPLLAQLSITQSMVRPQLRAQPSTQRRSMFR